MTIIDKIFLGIFLVNCIVAIALRVPFSQKVIVLWWTYFTCRRKWTRPSHLRWLWVYTIRQLDDPTWIAGQPLKRSRDKR